MSQSIARFVFDKNEWDESKHPRRSDGRFGYGGASAQASSIVKERLDKVLSGVDPSKMREAANALERAAELDDEIWHEKDKARIRELKKEKDECERKGAVLYSVAKKIWGKSGLHPDPLIVKEAERQLARRLGKKPASVLIHNG